MQSQHKCIKLQLDYAIIDVQIFKTRETFQKVKGNIMAKEIKTIGVLTSGGDAPGMNAAIRAVVRQALAKGIKVMGIRRGYHGLLREEIEEFNSRSVSDIIQRGGKNLGTARCM